MNIEME